MILRGAIAVIDDDGSMLSWSRENLEAFTIADYGQSEIALVEQSSRIRSDAPCLVLIVEREILGRVLFPEGGRR